MSEFSRTATQAFAQPECVDTVVRLSDHGGQHTEILQNFTEAILDGRPLIAPASEGIRSVELANAMLLSTWLDRAVELPLDGARFARLLRQHARRSVGPRRVPAPTVADDFAKSFNR